MTFISYAQNFEDVMLWRALGAVKNGFYVDIGANDPINDSVTKAFYDRGWRGINIEPTDQYFRKLVEQRPEDINLKMAIGQEPGELALYEISDTGLTTLDPRIASLHQDAGQVVIHTNTPVYPLSQILGSYRNREIHFLKIDVEGAEEQVLRGMDFTSHRPWLLVIEATLPNTQILCHETWEPLVLQAGYKFAYFDGANRFYVAEEHSRLVDVLATPPSRHFDKYILASEHKLGVELANKAAEYQQLEAVLHEREQQRQQLEAVLHEREQQRQQLEAALHEREQQRQQLEAALHEREQQRQQLEAALHEREQQRQQLEAALHERELQRQQLEAALHEREQQHQRLEAELHSVMLSRSWRITLPLRLAGKVARTWRQRLRQFVASPLSTGKQALKNLRDNMTNYVLARPGLKHALGLFLDVFPGLKQRMKRAFCPANPEEPDCQKPNCLTEISPRAAQILRDLKQSSNRD